MGSLPMEVTPGAIEKLLKSVEVQSDLAARGARIAAAGGDGMRVDVRVGRNRARVSVVTATKKARIAEATERRLTRALDAGRG